jgi:hypothetical protein
MHINFSWKSLMAIFLSPVGLFAQAQVPIPEDFLPAGRAQEYLVAASQFLEKHADDRSLYCISGYGALECG